MSDDGHGFLSRWARRKEAVREAEQEPPEERPERDEAAPPVEQKSEAEIAAELPDIDSLDEHSDFTVFMREGVPQHLRRLALRKLWRLNPLYNFTDGMAEYDHDYTYVTKPATEAIKTVYQVGKGMPRPEPKPPEERAAEAAVDEPDAAQALSSPQGEEAPDDRAAEPDAAVEQSGPEAEATSAQVPEAEQTEPVEPAPRRPEPGQAVKRRWGRFTSS